MPRLAGHGRRHRAGSDGRPPLDPGDARCACWLDRDTPPPPVDHGDRIHDRRRAPRAPRAAGAALGAAARCPTPSGRRPRPPSCTTRAAPTPGAVFVALRGQKDDGAQFAPQAVARGAVLVVAETPAPADPPGRLGRGAGRAPGTGGAGRSDSTATRAAPCRVVGITGTNGKTTTAYLLRSIFEAAGERCGLLGTVVYSVGRRGPRSDPDHTGSAGRAADAPRDGGQRLRGRGDGSVVARAGAQAGRRRAVCGRRLQQPDARSSRLPWRHGDRTSPPSAGCSRCCPTARRLS